MDNNPRPPEREAIYQKVDEYLQEEEYDEWMAPDIAEYWEDRIRHRIDNLEEGRADEEDPISPAAYRRGLLRNLADTVAAIEILDRQVAALAEESDDKPEGA